jgi:2-C-methyl-D-erythritol 2,4-cyclodiphosphate synthase
MRSRLAETLGLAVDRVSVKAKRAEQLGALGRREGIAAMAVALVEGVG